MLNKSKIFSIWCLILSVYLHGCKQPAPVATSAPLTPAQRLQNTVEHLATDIGERNFQHPKQLQQAGDDLSTQLSNMGYTVRTESYSAVNQTFRNFEAQISGKSQPNQIVIVGAHYDSAINTPGANDNGSGASVLMELARRFAKTHPNKTLRFVLFTNEEPPFFQQKAMGSLVYAKNCKERKEKIIAMISLETIGYYTDAPDSQNYPPAFRSMFPTTGNFIALVSNMESKTLNDRIKQTFTSSTKFPLQAASLPSVVPGVGFSDQWSFWEQGYPAVMFTDTALFRYPHYHAKTDTPDKIDYEKLAELTDVFEKILANLVD